MNTKIIDKVKNDELLNIIKDNFNEDIYLVNDSLNVYYLKGIERSDTIHHTNSD